MFRMLAFACTALVAAALMSCGGGGGGDGSSPPADDVGGGWVSIVDPKPVPPSTDRASISLSGEAFISKDWWRCCSGSADDTGVTVSWANATTGRTDTASHSVKVACLFGACRLADHTGGRRWTWRSVTTR